MPKVVNAEQVQLLADVINELEIEQNIDIGHTAIIAQIEDVNAMPHLDAIASSSPRMIGMTIGSEDFATSASMKPIPEALFVLKQQVLMACRRANIMPLGFPASIADYSDMQHFKAIITLAKNSALLALFVLILLR